MANTLRVAIDLGSTVSVMGWQWFSSGENKPFPVGEIKIAQYPTLILEQKDNPMLGQDLFGEEAQDLLEKNNGGVLFAKNVFKKKLLFPETKEEHAEGIRLTEKFFGFLYKCFQEDSPLPKGESAKSELYLTVPMSTNHASIQELERIAEKSGFSRTNGFQITVLNEAQCLVDYAFFDCKDGVKYT